MTIKVKYKSNLLEDQELTEVISIDYDTPFVIIEFNSGEIKRIATKEFHSITEIPEKEEENDEPE